MSISFVFATDIHGSRALMERLVEICIEMDAHALILGGDLLPPTRDPAFKEQVDFLTDVVGPALNDFKGRIFTIFGNNDWACVASKYEDLVPRMQVIESRHVELEGLDIVGFSYVPLTPFRRKDWDLFERIGPVDPLSIERGFCSRTGRLEPCVVSKDVRIADRLEMLGEIEVSVIVSHSPPWGTNQDIGRGGIHLGSRDLRALIIERRPLLVLCGHIHESPINTQEEIGSLEGVPVANPGSFSDRLSVIVGRKGHGIEIEHRSYSLG